MPVTRIKTNQITDGAVTTAKIADSNVTAGKLADNITYGSNPSPAIHCKRYDNPVDSYEYNIG